MIRFLIFLLGMPLLGVGQSKDIKIHVTLTGAPDGQKFYLFRAINWDSAVVKNGQFDLLYHKYSSQPEATVITTGYKESSLLCWVEKENITITATYPEFKVTTSTGSITQKEFDGLAANIKSDQAEIKKWDRQVINEKDSLKKALAREKRDSVNLIYKKKIKDFIYAHPGSSVSTFIIMVSMNETFTGTEVRELYAQLDKTQQESEMGSILIKTLEMLEQIQPHLKSKD